MNKSEQVDFDQVEENRRKYSKEEGIRRELLEEL